MKRLNSKTRILAVAAIAASLFMLFGIDPVVLLSVRSALRKIDPSVSVGNIDAAPGLLLLENIRFPEKELFLQKTVVYWSRSPFNPRLDSILVCNGSWEPVSDGGSENEPGSERSLPPVRFENFNIINGHDTVTVSGMLSGRSPGDSLKLIVESSWVSGTGTAYLGSGMDSVSVDWFRCSRLPEGIITMPEIIRGFVLEGRLSAHISDHIYAEGMITGIDGESAEVSFKLDDSSGSPEIELSTNLENVKDVLILRSEALLGDAFIDFSPTGSFKVKLMSDDTLGVSVDAGLDSIRIYSPGLADDTVNTSLALKFDGLVVLSLKDVSIDSGTVFIGNAPVNFNFSGRFDEYPRLSFRFWNDSLSGEDISSSVPSGLLGSLEGLELEGKASFDILVVLDWETPDSSDFQAEVNVSDLSVRASPISIGQLRNGGSCLMRDSWGNRRRVYLNPDENPGFVTFDSMQPSFEGLLRCAEDATFRNHKGFCLYHIRNSIRADLESGRFSRGGSTITMQLARNLFLGREKTLARKIQEVFLTWRLEVYLSKDRMLEIYANIVELGPNVFGFQEAARYYFSRDFPDLSTRQVAYLVSILPGPRLYHRFYSNGNVPWYWENYLDRLINISERSGWIDPDSASRARVESILFGSRKSGSSDDP